MNALNVHFYKRMHIFQCTDHRSYPHIHYILIFDDRERYAIWQKKNTLKYNLNKEDNFFSEYQYLNLLQKQKIMNNN